MIDPECCRRRQASTATTGVPEPCVAEHRGDLRMECGQHPVDLVELGVHVPGIGLDEEGAGDRGDHVFGSFGTNESALRMKSTRQGCQAAHWNTVPMDFFSPVGHRR
ncbi:hypothetical protein ACVWZ8_001610 [Arthrobacter sp. UYCu723]